MVATYSRDGKQQPHPPLAFPPPPATSLSEVVPWVPSVQDRPTPLIGRKAGSSLHGLGRMAVGVVVAP